MRCSALMLEIKEIEREIDSLRFENALFELMHTEVISSMIIAEQRKVVRFAIQLGITDKRHLNEGMLADLTLGIGQAVGGLPIFATTGLGAAFGVAGVLWYGKEMLNTSGFDFAMNLLFCLLSAAAIEPTGVFATSATLAKLIKPFVSLGQWAKNLGTLTVDGAKIAYTGLTAPSKLVVQGVVKAENPLLRGFDWIIKNVVPKVNDIFNAIKTQVMKLPGSGLFGRIAEKVSTNSRTALETVKSAIEALINFGKTALGQTAAKTAEAEAATAARAATTAGDASQAAFSALNNARRAGVDGLNSLLKTSRRPKQLQAFLDANDGNMNTVLRKYALGDPAAVKAVQAASPFGKAPAAVQRGVESFKTARATSLSQGQAAAAARTASATAAETAAAAAKVAADRTAAAQIAATRGVPRALKMFSTSPATEPATEYAPQV